MKKRIYRIEPILEERVWGGQKIREKFQYKTDLKNIAQVYHVIGIPNHLDNLVDTGEHLSEFYHNNPELFNCKSKDLPVRLVTACASGPLSIHLHPNDEYALEHEGMRGKVEGGVEIEEKDEWYVARVGHTAKTKEEFIELVEKKDFDRLLRKVTRKVGDFHHNPAGFLHGGTGDGQSIDVAWSTNGDVTYRLYDRDRNDSNRPLHIKEVIENVNIPDPLPEDKQPEPYKKEGCLIYDYYSKPKEYVARRIKTDGLAKFEDKKFMFILCGDGTGEINDESVKPGETIFIPADYGELTIKGKMDLFILSYID